MSCCVYSVEILLMMDSRALRNMQSTLSNKFEKLCIPLAFIIRIYHDARSSEYKKGWRYGNDLKTSLYGQVELWPPNFPWHAQESHVICSHDSYWLCHDSNHTSSESKYITLPVKKTVNFDKVFVWNILNRPVTRIYVNCMIKRSSKFTYTTLHSNPVTETNLNIVYRQNSCYLIN
jgi:hypothetical protein